MLLGVVIFYVDCGKQQQPSEYSHVFIKILEFMFGINALIDIPKVMKVKVY